MRSMDLESENRYLENMAKIENDHEKWEYKIVEGRGKTFGGLNSLVTPLNIEGNEGWEAVGITNISVNHDVAVLMKRLKS